MYENTSFDAHVNNTKLPLTEVSDPYNIASVSNNVITVGSGTYIIDFTCQAAEDDNNSGDYFHIQLVVGTKAVDSVKVDETGSTSTFVASTVHGCCYHPTDNQTFYINLTETDTSHVYLRHSRMVITKID